MREIRFVKFSDVSAALFEALATRGPRGGKQWRIAFALKKFVHQEPFADALPKEKDFEKPLSQAVESYFLALPALRST